MSNRVLNVIPAQAGIQLYPNRNLLYNNKIPPTYTFWIPACAGMAAWAFFFAFIKLSGLIAVFAASGRGGLLRLCL